MKTKDEMRDLVLKRFPRLNKGKSKLTLKSRMVPFFHLIENLDQYLTSYLEALDKLPGAVDARIVLGRVREYVTDFYLSDKDWGKLPDSKVIHTSDELIPYFPEPKLVKIKCKHCGRSVKKEKGSPNQVCYKCKSKK